MAKSEVFRLDKDVAKEIRKFKLELIQKYEMNITDPEASRKWYEEIKFGGADKHKDLFGLK